MPSVTLLYAGLLGIFSMVLSSPVGVMRAKKNIDHGDGGDAELQRIMRRHANFTEYVPLALLLVALLEMNGVRTSAIHSFGIALLAGRILHAAFFSAGVKSIPRGIGAGLTALVIVISSVWGITIYFTQ